MTTPVDPDFDDFDLTIMEVAEPSFGVQAGHQMLQVHQQRKCAGRGIPCCIHNPSDHHMREWEMNWRADTGVMERICPHGIGHPDPDHMAYVLSVNPAYAWQHIHGCDSCCDPSLRRVKLVPVDEELDGW